MADGRDSWGMIWRGIVISNYQIQWVRLSAMQLVLGYYTHMWTRSSTDTYIGGRMKRTVEYKVNRDLAEYTSGQHRLPGTYTYPQLGFAN
jgi:hypothetical protein